MKIILPDGSVEEAKDELRAIRHTASHVLAQAVKRLYPETKLAIGPAIDDGFYYDFDREGGFTPDDLEKLEAEMKKIVKENLALKHSFCLETKQLNLCRKRASLQGRADRRPSRRRDNQLLSAG